MIILYGKEKKITCILCKIKELAEKKQQRHMPTFSGEQPKNQNLKKEVQILPQLKKTVSNGNQQQLFRVGQQAMAF